LRHWSCKSHGFEEFAPAGEHEIGGESRERLEEALAGHQFASRGLPCPITEVADRMKGERRQIQRCQDAGEMLLPMPEVVFQVVALGLENVERLVLDLPTGTPAGGSSTTLSRCTGRSVMKLLR
jgi:hypothetical protein